MKLQNKLVYEAIQERRQAIRLAASQEDVDRKDAELIEQMLWAVRQFRTETAVPIEVVREKAERILGCHFEEEAHTS